MFNIVPCNTDVMITAQEIWNMCRPGVVTMHYYTSQGILINSLSAFRSGDYLITDQSAYTVDKASEVEIVFRLRSFKQQIIRIGIKDYKKCIVKSVKDNAAFVLFKLNDLASVDIPSLKIAKKRNYQIGTPITTIGFQLDQRVTCMKTGIISAFLKSGNQPFIQFDAPMNQGNSGCPLFNLETGEVIGIAGYRLAIINKQHNKLMKIINNNLEKIKTLEGKYKHENIDVSQVLSVIQSQIKHLAHDYNRQPSLHYGFALEIAEVSDLFPSE